MNIGPIIKEIRKQKGITQVDLASKAGVTQAGLSQIESGTRPDDETLTHLCASLGVSVGFIYLKAIENEPTPIGNHLYPILLPVIKDLLLKIVS
jgi:transcriptional regulator with XRE-family HTH domain